MFESVPGTNQYWAHPELQKVVIKRLQWNVLFWTEKRWCNSEPVLLF